MPTFTPEQEKWIRSRPPAVEAVIRAAPPTTCYRLKGNSGHYWITSYCESKGEPVTVKIEHLEDSYGFMYVNGQPVAVEVFGVDPTDLVPCGCMVTARKRGGGDTGSRRRCRRTAARAKR